MKYTYLILIGAILLAFVGCEQSDPPPINKDIFGRAGDTLTFAGIKWRVKSAQTPVGPGPNYFSKRDSDVFLDNNGYLHLKITQFESRWWSTEVVSVQNMGYGRYTWTIEGDLENITDNIVLGLFTWDHNTFQAEANSEVDIEFAKWGNASLQQTLLYSLQPINFAGPTPERTERAAFDPTKNIGITTHSFNWTDTLVSWSSWTGEQFGVGTPYATFSYDLNNPPRVKVEGGRTSNPIVIPKPGATTNARMNFWINTWLRPGPTDGKEQEVIIRDFDYVPM